MPDSDDSQGGYTLLVDEPVLVEDLPGETRFQGPELLTSHGVHSGMSVTIRGEDGRPWGVLGVHDRRPRRFIEDDVRCLEAVAHILGVAIVGERAQRVLREERSRLRRTVEEAPIPIMVRTEDGRILQVNRAWQRARRAPQPPRGLRHHGRASKGHRSRRRELSRGHGDITIGAGGTFLGLPPGTFLGLPPGTGITRDRDIDVRQTALSDVFCGG